MCEYFKKYTIANVCYERTVRYISKKKKGKDTWTYVLNQKIHYRNDNLIGALLDLNKVTMKINTDVSVKILDIDIIYNDIMKVNYDVTKQSSYNEHYIPISNNSSCIDDGK